MGRTSRGERWFFWRGSRGNAASGSATRSVVQNPRKSNLAFYVTQIEFIAEQVHHHPRHYGVLRMICKQFQQPHQAERWFPAWTRTVSLPDNRVGDKGSPMGPSCCTVTKAQLEEGSGKLAAVMLCLPLNIHSTLCNHPRIPPIKTARCWRGLSLANRNTTAFLDSSRQSRIAYNSLTRGFNNWPKNIVSVANL